MIKKLTILLVALLPLLAISYSTAQVAPPPPTNLTVTEFMGWAKLDWDVSPGPVSYRVYKALDTLPFMHIAQVMQNHFIDMMVPPGHVYRYYVTAVNNGGESLPSNDVVFTPGGPPPMHHFGFISGTILDDSTGQPIPCVRVRFFKPWGFMYFREARTDTMGRYFAPLDTGKYLVFASKWPYLPEWFDNAKRFEDATPVAITQGDTSIANFGLTQIAPPPPHLLVSVSGTVTDSITGNPIKGAFVLIMRTVRETNIMENDDGAIFGNRNEMFFLPELGTLSGVIRATKTDSAGNYTLIVPDNAIYIMLAFMEHYVPEFYNNKKTPYDADRLVIHGNTTGINFDLVPNPNVQNSLAGKVLDDSGNGVISKVLIFKKATHSCMLPMRFTHTDSLGNYSFSHLLSGYYYAKAIPMLPYAPAWYNTDSCGARFWASADSFLVDGNVTDINICVKPINITPGFASISGNVNETQTGTLVQGATVYALSAVSGTVSGYDITENDGSFIFSNLAPGSYKLVADKEGYSSSESPTLTVDANNNYTLSSADLGIKDITLNVGKTDNTIPEMYSLKQNYPNPFNPSTKISFGLPSRSMVQIEIYNLLGQRVKTLLSGELSAGNFSLEWNGTDGGSKNVTSGVYFYKMTARSPEKSFTSIKKMLLVK